MPETLDMDDIVDKLTEYEGWEQQGHQLVKVFEFEDFASALAFVEDVGAIAEDMEHHPDITIQNYNEVMLRIGTHDLDAITDLDFEFVDRVEDLL